MIRVLLIAGSQRRQYNCPGVDGKSRTFMKRMARRLAGQFDIDEVDLANVYASERIQPCNACVSTSMALCVWPCNCYAKDDKDEPDLMWNLDLYARLDQADAWGDHRAGELVRTVIESEGDVRSPGLRERRQSARRVDRA